MIQVDNQEIKELLLTGNFGLEREGLRVMPDGTFSHTPHPFSEGEKHIVYDFCENQTEINTSVGKTAEQAVEMLYHHTKQIQKRLADMPEPELLWPFSNPPYIRNEKDIPVAKDKESAGYKQGYRDYLGDRYGRYKMALSGIHVNYSFSEELLQAAFKQSGEEDYQEFKNQLYVVLAERCAGYAWIMTALTAASPIMDGSYLEKGKQGTSVFTGMGSIRCSELGYWNYFSPLFDYSNVRAYADSIQRYVDDGFIASPTELYYPIRLKPAGKNNLQRLHDEGVNHIELRMVDVNPYEESGINVKDLKFAQLLLVWLASTKRQKFILRDQVQAGQNFKNAAHYDLKTVKIVTPDKEVFSVAHAGRKVIGFIRDFYQNTYADMPEILGPILEILDFEEDKFINPENRYAWQVRRDYEEDYVVKGLELARLQQEHALAL